MIFFSLPDAAAVAAAVSDAIDSAFPVSDVDGATSTTVSGVGAGVTLSATFAPHSGQKPAPSGNSFPQF